MRRTVSAWVWLAEEKWVGGGWVWSAENQSNGLIGVGWVLRWRTGWRRGSNRWKTKAMVWAEALGRRRGSATWGLGRLGPVTLRPAEAWFEDVETKRWEWLRERERGTEWLREREPLFIILIHPGVKYYYYCLALSYSAHLSIDVHYSNGSKKSKFSSTARACFLGVWGAKNTNMVF